MKRASRVRPSHLHQIQNCLALIARRIQSDKGCASLSSPEARFVQEVLKQVIGESRRYVIAMKPIPDVQATGVRERTHRVPIFWPDSEIAVNFLYRNIFYTMNP